MSARANDPGACEHANECPHRCPCRAGCYCKTRTCQTVLPSRALAEHTAQIGAFRELDRASTAPMVACFRAVASGYPKLSILALLKVAWACFVWEREGKIPSDRPIPFTWKGGV